MQENSDFRTRLIEIASAVFPEVEFQPCEEDEDVVLAGEMRMGIPNLRAKFELSEQRDEDLEALVSEHLGPLLSREIPELDKFSFDELRDQILPQIMPSEYAAQTESELLAYPLSSGISIGLVADFPQTYMYLREEDVERWDTTPEEVYEVALHNLEQLSANADFQLFGSGNNTIIAVESGDSFDAARILVPSLQNFFATHLGDTFRFGIPNRDFVICWRLDCEPEFHTMMIDKIIQNNAERPYPLSPSVFVRNSEGNLHEQPA